MTIDIRDDVLGLAAAVFLASGDEAEAGQPKPGQDQRTWLWRR